MATLAIPHLDPSVRYVGVSKLRDLNAARLRDNSELTYVFQDNDQPLAVLISYDMYLFIQRQLHEGMVNTIEMVTSPDEIREISTGLQEVLDGHTRPFSEVKADLKATSEKER